MSDMTNLTTAADGGEATSPQPGTDSQSRPGGRELGTDAIAAEQSVDLFDLPFKADDLAPGERYCRNKKAHGGSNQALGYDLGARRLDTTTGKWSSRLPGTDPSRNDSLVVYGKPVYAMRAGVVIKGWRNAPENPGPGQHHPQLGTGIIGGGNHLVVRHDDGSLVLYAHLQPGTVPQRLVPHNAVLLPGNDPDARNIPEDQQVRIRSGEFLGRVGNSGKSSGPHLHVHRSMGNAADLRFRRGLATPVQEGTADLDHWTSFAGKRIPSGPVLIWPPRTLRPEYVRHAFPVRDFGRMFHHLTDSGYAPTWIDGYTVAGQDYLNFVWRPATRPWRGYFGLPPERYQNAIEAAVAEGYQPVFVESYNGEDTRYNLIAAKGTSGSFWARHGLSGEQHQALLDDAIAEGLTPAAVSVVSVHGRRRYTVLYRSQNSGPWRIKSQVKETDYQEVFEAEQAKGRRPVYLQGYVHQGTAYLSAIFASDHGSAYRAVHGLSSSEYQQAFDDSTGAGLRTLAVTGTDGTTSQHRFAAVWTGS